MRVQQAVSLQKVYTDQAEAPGRKLVEDRIYKVRTDGPSRLDRTKTSWERFSSRHSNRMSRIADCFCSKDRSATREADRFNHRHEKFSAKVQNFALDLRAGKLERLSNPEYLATLRHDVKLMNQDMRWAGRQTIFEKRLDVEFSKWDTAQLDRFAEQLGQVETNSLDSRGLKDLEVIKLSLVRQQLSRNPMLGQMARGLAQAPENAPQAWVQFRHEALQMQNAAMGLGRGVGVDLSRAQLCQLIHGSTVMALKSTDQRLPDAQLGAANRHYQSLRDDAWQKKSGTWPPSTEADPGPRPHANPVEQAYAKGLREVFLLKKIPPTYRDEQLQTRFTRVGKGAAHEVSKGVYPNKSDTTNFVSKVHKSDDDTIIRNDRYFGAPHRIGVDHHDPRLLERSYFTSRVDAFLGLGVSVVTDFALHHDTAGIVMDLSSGTTAREDGIGLEMNDGEVQRQFAKLQVLDLVTGQMDRHTSNYMLRRDEQFKFLGLAAIDSDFCMGIETDPSQNICREKGIHYRGFPPVIDSEMHAKLLELSPRRVEDLAEDMFGVQSLAGVNARVQKFLALVQAGKVLVIEPKAWGSAQVTERLTSGMDISQDPKSVEDLDIPLASKTSLPSGSSPVALMSYWARDYDAVRPRDLGEEAWI